MPVDRAGRRTARIARTAVDVAWYLGLAVWVVMVAALVAGPFLEASGYVVRFDWNAFRINEGTGPPVVELRVSGPSEDAVTSCALTSPDTTLVSRPLIQERVESRLAFHTSQPPFFYASNATAPLFLASVLLGVYMLRAFLADVSTGGVFTARNAKRLASLGWLLIVLDVASPQLERLRAWAILKHIELSGSDLSPVLPASRGMWLMGLVVLVLAAAWRYGGELQEDRDLTA